MHFIPGSKHISRLVNELLVSMRQTFSDSTREIWILVGSAGALVNQATLFEFCKRETTGSDGVTFIKHFVSFPIKEHSPIPRDALVDGALRANIGRAVVGQGVVPARVVS